METIVSDEIARRKEILDFLDSNVFNPALTDPRSNITIKTGVRRTKERMSTMSSWNMVEYFWAVVIGTERSMKFSTEMKKIGLKRFEESIDEFRVRFGEDWLSKIPVTAR